METPPTPSPAPNEARARKERLGAKIKARGAARLERITNMKEPSNDPSKPSDRPNPPEYTQVPRSTPPLTGEATGGSSNPDPDEIDISQHYYTPGTGSSAGQSPQQPQLLDEQQFLRLMIGQSTAGRQPSSEGLQNPFALGSIDTSVEGGDPLMGMFREIIGFPGGPLDSTGPQGDGISDGALPRDDSQHSGSAMHAYVWKALHACFAIALAIYIVVTTSFVGTRAARRQEPPAVHVAPGISGVNFFWLFATIELLLQSTRFFLEKGRAPQESWLGKIARLLPPPFAGYLAVSARYSVIYTMIVQDGMLIVFVLGCVAWWNGGAIA